MTTQQIISFREATAQDEPTIREMIKAEQLDPTSLNWRHFLIAEDGETVVGIGQIKAYPGCRELGSLVTHPDYRGRGIATRMIAQLEERATFPLYLLCAHWNEAFYERNGYVTIPWRAAPWILKLKTLPAPLIRLIFKAKIRIMCKEAG